MLEKVEDRVAGGATVASMLPGGEDRRRAGRFAAAGAEVFLFLECGRRCRLGLRDLCTLGASGPTDAPVQVGDRVTVQLEEMMMPEAQIVWARGGVIGLVFLSPLPLMRLQRLHERHEAGVAWSPAMRAGSDLHAWWTESAAHAEGRRARLNAGGHDHPLPR